MIRAAVIGDPVQHSLSPKIHGYWLQKYGIEGAYEALTIPAGQLGASIKMLKTQLNGFNVTLPHKEDMLKFCDRLDPVARIIGAVNTVTIRGGEMTGSNTDAFGFIENLRAQYPAFAPAQPVLVLGAGGAARAALYALIEAGVRDIILCNRNQSRALTLAGEEYYAGHIRVVPWEMREAHLPEAGLIVNTTSLGLRGQETLEMDLSRAQAGTAIYDIVYRPLMTDLLLQARARHLNVITGLGMLLHQARPGFASWFGVMPAIDDTLIGMMEQAAT